MKNRRVEIPFDETDDFFSQIMIPGTESFSGELSRPSDGVSEVYELSRRAEFITVARAAAKITDSYDEDVPLTSSNPRFSALTFPQMRRYFTLRERFRKGRYESTYVSYIYLYINEIINLIGIDSYEKGASEIASILCENERKIPNLTTDCKRYLRDFYVVYNIPGNFYDFVKNLGAERHFPDAVLPESTEMRIAVFYNNADFHIPKSDGFFTTHYSAESFLRKAFYSVIENAEPFFELMGKPFLRLESDYFISNRAVTPFSGATFSLTPTRVGKAVISASESYFVTEKNITKQSYNMPKSASIFFGFLLEVIEAHMRILCSYKYPLHPDENEAAAKITVAYDALSQFFYSILGEADLAKIVYETVLDLYRKSVRFIIKEQAAGVSETSKSIAEKLSREPYKTFLKISKNSGKSKTGSISDFAAEADLLWDFSGNFGVNDFTSGTYSFFSDLSPKDLAAYITIRTRVFGGDIKNVPALFWFFRLSELITTARLGDEEVFAVIAGYLKNSGLSFLADTLKGWYAVKLRDKMSFRELTDKHGITQFFPEVFVSFDFELMSLDSISDYKITKSKFYTAKNAELAAAVIPKLFVAVCGYFKAKNIELKKYLFTEQTEGYVNFFDELNAFSYEIPRNTKIPLSDTYYYLAEGFREMTCYSAAYENKVMPQIIGFIIKNAEIAMRDFTGTKGKISISVSFKTKLLAKFDKFNAGLFPKTKAKRAFAEDMLRIITEVLEPDFEHFIKSETEKICEKISPREVYESRGNYAFKEAYIPVKVEIDFDKLGEIREDSREVAEKLGAVYEEPKPLKAKEQTPQKENKPVLGDDINKRFIKLLSDGKKSEAEKLARENGTMFEVLAEKINEIFQEKIGDIVIENGEIIPEYKSEINDYLNI